MADSSFEEQVRRELDALRLKPEEQVWLNVAAALREKKKRRGFFWLLLLAALGGAMAIYLLRGTGARNEVAQQRNKITSIEKVQANAGRQLSPPITTNDGSVRDNKNEKDGISTTIDEANAVTKSPGKNDIAHPRGTNEAPPAKSRGNNVEPKGELLNMKKASPGLQRENDPPASAKGSQEASTANSSAVGPIPVTAATDSAKFQARVEPGIPSSRINSAMDSSSSPATVTAKSPNKKTSKWTWHIRAEAGIGGSVKPVSVAPSPNLYASFPTGNPGAFLGSSAAPLYRKDIYTGVALSALKKLGKKASAGISVGYADYRENVGVGSRYDTLVSFSNINSSNQGRFVYRPADTASFANRYQFLQLAVDYYSDFGKGLIPLRWHAGGGAAILLAGKSLHYDGNTGLMFRNDDLIPGFQWFASAGIDVGFGRKRFFAGPAFTYFLSKDSRVSTDSRHLFNASFRVGMQLGKK